MTRYVGTPPARKIIASLLRQQLEVMRWVLVEPHFYADNGHRGREQCHDECTDRGYIIWPGVRRDVGDSSAAHRRHDDEYFPRHDQTWNDPAPSAFATSCLQRVDEAVQARNLVLQVFNQR